MKHPQQWIKPFFSVYELLKKNPLRYLFPVEQI